MDSLTVGAALAGMLAPRLAQRGGERLLPAPLARVWRLLRPRLAPVPDAAGALAELRTNPRNRAAGLVLGDEIAHLLDADPELFRLAAALVGRAGGPTAAAA